MNGTFYNKAKKALQAVAVFFNKSSEEAPENGPADVITQETDELWKMARDKDEGLITETDCRNRIAESFKMLNERFTQEKLDSIYTWPK